MKLPIRNRGSKDLTLIIEPIADEYTIPVGGKAIVYLADGCTHSIDMHGDFMIVWDDGGTYQALVVYPDEGTEP